MRAKDRASVSEFCSTTRACIEGVWHSVPILPRMAIRALASPETSRDLPGMRMAKAYSLALLAPTAPFCVALATALAGPEASLRLTRAHIESLDRPDITLEMLLQLKGKIRSMRPEPKLLPVEATMMGCSTERLRAVVRALRRGGGHRGRLGSPIFGNSHIIRRVI